MFEKPIVLHARVYCGFICISRLVTLLVTRSRSGDACLHAMTENAIHRALGNPVASTSLSRGGRTWRANFRLPVHSRDVQRQ
jgi:hypothetical protein